MSFFLREKDIMNINRKELKQVVLENEALDTYNKLKIKLMMENDSDVLRFAIKFTEKRFK